MTKKTFSKIIIIILSITMIILTDQRVVKAAVDCTLTYNEAWNNKFPIGLIAGNPPTTSLLSNDCPVFDIFGYTYPVCSIGQLLVVVKNVVLIKFIISSIQTL